MRHFHCLTPPPPSTFPFVLEAVHKGQLSRGVGYQKVCMGEEKTNKERRLGGVGVGPFHINSAIRPL
jgi:hypothetical protein